MNYNKPIHERYGDRLFEFLLRDRHEDDAKPPAFIYQIKERMTEGRFINKLRSNCYFKVEFKPSLMERKKIVVMGRKVMHNNIGSNWHGKLI